MRLLAKEVLSGLTTRSGNCPLILRSLWIYSYTFYSHYGYTDIVDYQLQNLHGNFNEMVRKCFLSDCYA